ncbi:hypothetical protein Aph02nite_31950 [Actinoplanes philippinensis]|uniref:Putative ABC transport system permease protein n=1 Tax=Actinoplanes philippinensis TaxID=35752 RepID=A0A1I2E6X1_9ACTN|nr:ABC transporter permease [Actinoplanes philippinensis]GIE77245.1 hypothetical protein Aph02nite_31950 [Actinoplanes philippinensis]SFE88228.1 putative ABC transport system permease protein [Actinoplanes philippinensis]
MLIVTLSSLRARWASLVGTFVALCLGVALIATMGLALASTVDAPPQHPSRLAGAAVVVRGADELRVPTRIGDRSQPLADPHAIPPALAAILARTGPTVIDRSFPVRAAFPPSGAAGSAPPPSHPGDNDPPHSGAAGADAAGAGIGEVGDLVGHPWAVAGLGGHRLVAGREPREGAEVALAADPAIVGRTISLRTPSGRGDYTVAGVLAPVTFERAVFFTDDTAASIAPRIDNLAVDAAPERVREIAGRFPGVQVLTGDDRRRADPDPDRDSDSLVAMNALLGTAGGITTFVSVFVVASTFAFAVAQRRREMGLLRMAGATPRQIRRSVLAEAVVAGAVASAAGCLLGSLGAPWLAGVLVEERLAPAWFTIGDHRWPYHVAFWTGLLVALAGVVVATIRAGRVRPTEALREASVDSRAMTAGRWIFGVGFLAAGLGLLCWRLLTDPGEVLHRKTYTTQPMLLITAVALLAPVLAGPLARLVAWLPARLPGATGMLMRENTSASLRRTAAVAAPILITVALAGSLLGTTATITRAKATELSDSTVADLIVTGVPDARTLAAIRAVPGAQVMTSASTSVYTLEDGVALVRSQARAVDPETLTAVRRLPVKAGDPGDLTDDGIIVNEEWAARTLGDRVQVWLGDGTPRALRIVAVLATGTGGNGVYVTPHNAGGAQPDTLELSWLPGSDSRSGEAEVRRLLDSSSRNGRTDPPPTGLPDQGTPRTTETSPSGRQSSPRIPGTNPPERESGPRTAETSPRGRASSAGTAETNPPRRENSQGTAETSPPKREDSPITAETSPPGRESGGGTAGTGPTDPPGRHGLDAEGGEAVEGSAGSTTMLVQTREQWLAAQLPQSSRQTQVGYLVVLGIALLYAGIAIANTMVMATSDRVREMAVLRLTGATRMQVLRLVAAEALTVVVVGAILGLLVTALNLLGIWAALATLSVWVPLTVPWADLAATLIVCAVIAVLAAVLPAAMALRTRPAELAGTRH